MSKGKPAGPSRVRTALAAALGAAHAAGNDRFAAALQVIAEAFEARTATLHRRPPGEATLELVASRGLPGKLLSATTAIPFGKGMAGLCAARREPVTVCNLQTDSSGCARPAARETGVAGAVVVPVIASSGELVGTLGIGKPGAHEYTEAEMETLRDCAGLLAEALEGRGSGGRGPA
jgi:L-methionine (R)-S-oxide reductase